MCFLQVFADFLSFVVNFWPGDDFLGGSSAKTSIFPYNFLERQSCRDPYLSIRISRRACLGQEEFLTWRQFKWHYTKSSSSRSCARKSYVSGGREMLAGRAGPARFVCVLYMVLCAKERITGCCAGTGRAGARRMRKREKWTPALALAPKF